MGQGISTNVAVFMASLYVLLAVASLIQWALRKKLEASAYTELSQRITSWWVMVTVFVIAMLVSRTVSLWFFGLMSFLALKEFLSMIPTRRADRRVLFWAYLSIPAQYYWVSQEWYGMFIIFIPIYVFLFLPMRMVMIGETKDFLRAAGTLHWGLMTMVFSISHIAYLLVLPSTEVITAGGAGLVLYLVFLTQFNDVAQYCWGKLFGKHKIVPSVSPNKTWQGFLGGVATTSLLAVVLAPILTGQSMLMALGAGFLISVSGFIGDVTISALKRDIGVKDSGSLLPGHGGILDRVDSLTYAAPLFFHYVWYLSY